MGYDNRIMASHPWVLTSNEVRGVPYNSTCILVYYRITRQDSGSTAQQEAGHPRVTMRTGETPRDAQVAVTPG